MASKDATRVVEAEGHMSHRVRKFTPGRKKAFVDLLAKGHSRTRAAKEVGVSTQAAYE